MCLWVCICWCWGGGLDGGRRGERGKCSNKTNAISRVSACFALHTSPERAGKQIKPQKHHNQIGSSSSDKTWCKRKMGIIFLYCILIYFLQGEGTFMRKVNQFFLDEILNLDFFNFQIDLTQMNVLKNESRSSHYRFLCGFFYERRCEFISNHTCFPFKTASDRNHFRSCKRASRANSSGGKTPQKRMKLRTVQCESEGNPQTAQCIAMHVRLHVVTCFKNVFCFFHTTPL